MGDMSREPSMEDILSSIRRVIARDEDNMQAPLSRLTPAMPDHAPAILELDQGFGEEDVSLGSRFAADTGFSDPSIPIAAPAPAEKRERATPAPEPIRDDAMDSDASLVSHESADAARQSLDTLNSALSAAPELPGTSRTIDDLVMEALRPMLKQWLDHNLPPLVETMVSREIARITGRSV